MQAILGLLYWLTNVNIHVNGDRLRGFTRRNEVMSQELIQAEDVSQLFNTHATISPWVFCFQSPSSWLRRILKKMWPEPFESRRLHSQTSWVLLRRRQTHARTGKHSRHSFHNQHLGQWLGKTRISPLDRCKVPAQDRFWSRWDISRSGRSSYRLTSKSRRTETKIRCQWPNSHPVVLARWISLLRRRKPLTNCCRRSNIGTAIVNPHQHRGFMRTRGNRPGISRHAATGLVGVWTYRSHVRSRSPINASDVQIDAIDAEKVELSKNMRSAYKFEKSCGQEVVRIYTRNLLKAPWRVRSRSTRALAPWRTGQWSGWWLDHHSPWLWRWQSYCTATHRGRANLLVSSQTEK